MYFQAIQPLKEKYSHDDCHFHEHMEVVYQRGHEKENEFERNICKLFKKRLQQ